MKIRRFRPHGIEPDDNGLVVLYEEHVEEMNRAGKIYKKALKASLCKECKKANTLLLERNGLILTLKAQSDEISTLLGKVKQLEWFIKQHYEDGHPCMSCSILKKKNQQLSVLESRALKAEKELKDWTEATEGE